MELPTKGLLSEVSFIEILKDASVSTLTGMIRLETGSVIKVVYLQNGTIAFASSNEKTDRLTEVLKRAGKLTPEQIEHAQARIKPNVSLGKTLVELGYISPKDLLWGARMQVEGILYQLLFWDRGSYQVLEGPLPREIVSLGLTVPQIIYNGILQTRNRDWILQHIGSPEAIYTGAKIFDDRNAEYHLPVDDVVSKMDGKRSLEEIAQATGIDTFEVCKMVAALQILELVELQANKPSQMSFSDSETTEPPTTEEEHRDISLGQVLQIPTVADLQQGPQETPEAEPYDVVEEIIEQESTPPRNETIPETPPARVPTFGEIHKVESTAREDFNEFEDEQLEEAGRGWKKIVLVIAILAVLAAGAAFYYVFKSSKPSTSANEKKVQPEISTPSPEKKITEVPETSTVTPQQEPSQAPPTEEPSVQPVEEKQPLEIATSGNLAAAAKLWKAELNKKRNQLTIQVEIACQEKTVLEAINLFGKTAPLYVVPLSFRGQACYRVLYGIYDRQEQADAELTNLPSQFLQQPSPPKVIPISKAL